MGTGKCARLLLVLAAMGAAGAAAQDRVETWDGLPAFDPLHLRGAYTGTRVCPMCRHGYDAGFVLFVPVATDVDALRTLAQGLRDAEPAGADGRFRTFVVFTGGEPAAAQVDAVSDPRPTWFVAQLHGAPLQAAESDFGWALRTQPVGYLFAQRRLLERYEGDALPGVGDSTALRAGAEWAMAFLDTMHPEPVRDADPDVPRGLLWTAPSRLVGTVALAKDDRGGDGGDARRVCVDAGGGARLRDALVSVSHHERTDATPRRHWARSDGEGCVAMSGGEGDVRLRLWAPRQPERVVDVSLSALHPGTATIVPAAADVPTGSEPVVGRCEGCEAVFQGLPAAIPSRARIGTGDEPGAPMRLEGTVFDRHGRPAPGMVVYAYQTDDAGAYPRDASLSGAAARHGRLRAWVRSDGEGRYRFDTVRPGAYPGREAPEHVHMHVIEPGRCTYYIQDTVFEDDPLLTPEHRRPPETARGGSGVVQPQRRADGGWHAVRDIHLGRNVLGYARCDGARAG